jgi:class 3 adenylate cyclase/tetratricopeptide (TPR) repeat protein
MLCPNCGNENRSARPFCSKCGTRLAGVCSNCGAANEADDQFCGDCGSPLAAPPTSEGSTRARGPAEAERRLVSVLFADLVGFTALSEDRDAEEVRELLSKYFDLCRRLIARYGGTVEKFIGDAVMAVWGTPTAQEDDAERAVRAALELSTAVATLGTEVGAADLQARVGVLTGEAAVTLGATGEGMVAGDLVNTASRIQSVAPPGAVLVGDTTRRTTEAAIAYEDAGLHELKGKEEAAHLFRAVRVIGGRRGALRAAGLEAPFVGREREMRLAKELFHASSEEGKAHLVSVVGVAGVGKTRLSWEFEKYIDGLAQDVWWHRGRCLAYGEGVAYWALAEMVRSRAGILEGEEPDSALAKMRAMIGETFPDPEERSWVEPRLAHLLGLEERATREQADLFSAWRLFFERLAERGPVEMIFEDLQWADDALLDFIEYQLEWSRDHPLFILTLSRPEITDRRPTWGAGKRNFTSLSLEPLAPEAMEKLMRGLVPGLPEEITSRILDRAQGIPLYAVETVRMLLDRGLLSKEDGEYHPTGPVEDLQVPESLHGLIAARLDGLTSEERRLIQDASVLGKTFSKPALAGITTLKEAQLDGLLTKLVRKELLSVQADPRSPERGQYGFLQDLVKKVAHETLSKKERKARHLAFADYLETSWGGDPDEIVEILASNLLEAYRAAPEASDAGEIRTRARDTIARAGERAASLAANEEAKRYFEQAADLSVDALVKAGLLERAGEMAWLGARAEEATDLMERAISLFEGEGDTHAAARVTARLGEITWVTGRIEEAIGGMERSFEVLSADQPDEGLASLAAQLGRFLYFAGQHERAAERLERALEIAESLWLPEVLSMALNSKGALILMSAQARPREGFALLKESLELALENDYPSAAMRAYYNLANLLYYYDRYEESFAYARDGMKLARKQGHRLWEWNFQAELVYLSFVTGDWDDAIRQAADIPPLEESAATRPAAGELVLAIPPLLVARGLADEAAEVLTVDSAFEGSADLQERTYYLAAKAALLRSQRKFREALAAGQQCLDGRALLGTPFPGVREGFVEAMESALALGDLETAEQLMAVPRGFGQGEFTPSWRGHTNRLEARLAAARGESDGVDARFKAAVGHFREIGIPYWVAITLGEHAEWLTAQGRADEAAPLVAEAREIFERLKARPWLERLRSLEDSHPAGVGERMAEAP